MSSRARPRSRGQSTSTCPESSPAFRDVSREDQAPSSSPYIFLPAHPSHPTVSHHGTSGESACGRETGDAEVWTVPRCSAAELRPRPGQERSGPRALEDGAARLIYPAGGARLLLHRPLGASRTREEWISLRGQSWCPAKRKVHRGQQVKASSGGRTHSPTGAAVRRGLGCPLPAGMFLMPRRARREPRQGADGQLGRGLVSEPKRCPGTTRDGA